MSFQESALYGDLVLYLRDHAAELLVSERGDVEREQERLDRIIRDWFFTPQDNLHGCAPRDLIWAEQRGVPNPVDPEHLDEFFLDDCPVRRAELEAILAALETGGDPGWRLYHDDGRYPLIARYDPEGWDACWDEEETLCDEWQDDQRPPKPDLSSPLAEAYAPFPIEPDRVTPEEFVAQLRQLWVDPALHRAAKGLTSCLDCPELSMFGLRYRPISYEEALSLLIGLYEHGVNVEMLLAHIDAFPYEKVALDWLSQPAENAALVVDTVEHEVEPDDEAELARLRHHRDFIFVLSRMIPPAAQRWLQRWLDAVAMASLCARSGMMDVTTPDGPPQGNWTPNPRTTD